MMSLVAALIVVPLLDQVVKLLLLHRVQRCSLPLGPIGTVRCVQAHIWLMRLSGRWTPAMTWVLWISAASALTIVCVLVPPLAWPSGLVLGGSLSHAVEISRRGSVCDYICLRLWPAFDLADLALTLGAAGILIELLAVLPRPWG